MFDPVVTTDEVREFLADYADNNHLIDGVEFSDTRISLATKLAVSEFNTLPPVGAVSVNSFMQYGSAVLMYGICWKLMEGQAALLARNTMSYSDGGISLPIEERMQLYLSLAGTFRDQYMSAAQRLKQHLNLEAGWGEVRSDQASFPTW